MKVLAVAVALFIPSLALADKPLPASQHTPPLVLDEASVSIGLYGQGDEGYRWHSHVEVVGFTAKNDRMRMEWKSKGKIVVTGKCAVSVDDGFADALCEHDGASIKAVGPIEAELIYSDDQTDKDYLVRTFKFDVVHLSGSIHAWQLVPDDLLAAAYVWMGNDDETDSTYRRPVLYLTFANGNSLRDGALRCTGNGKKIPDIALGEETGSDTFDLTLDDDPKKGQKRVYHWHRSKFLIEALYGKRETLKVKDTKETVLQDNPGKWECALRHDGKVIRQINFVVDKDGWIQNDEIQTGKNAIPMVSDRVVLVDVRLTKDSATYDTRINPAAMKKSMGFGLPWPDHPKVKTIQASYPPKSGYPDPK